MGEVTGPGALQTRLGLGVGTWVELEEGPFFLLCPVHWFGEHSYDTPKPLGCACERAVS